LVFVTYAFVLHRTLDKPPRLVYTTTRKATEWRGGRLLNAYGVIPDRVRSSGLPLTEWIRNE